jgi:hypothetical protein
MNRTSRAAWPIEANGMPRNVAKSMDAGGTKAVIFSGATRGWWTGRVLVVAGQAGGIGCECYTR